MTGMKTKTQTFDLTVLELVYQDASRELLHLDNRQLAGLKKRKKYKQVVSKTTIAKISINIKVRA